MNMETLSQATKSNSRDAGKYHYKNYSLALQHTIQFFPMFCPIFFFNFPFFCPIIFSVLFECPIYFSDFFCPIILSVLFECPIFCPIYLNVRFF